MAVRQLSKSTVTQGLPRGSKLWDQVSTVSDFDLLSTTILTSNQASVTFDVSTFASTYKHLQIRMLGRTNKGTSGDTLSMQFNNDTGSSYNMHYLQGNGSSVGSGYGSATSLNYFIDVPSTADSAGYTPAIIDIVDAFSSTKYKTTKVLWGDTVKWNAINVRSFYWSNTSAITTIKITTVSANSLVSGSRFSIYGIKG